MKNTIFPIITENEKKLPYFIHSVGVDCHQEHVSRSAGYPCYLWIQCRAGSGHLKVDGNDYQISKGMAMFLLPNEPHEYRPDADNWIVDWVGITGANVADFFKGIATMSRSGVFHVADPDSIRSTLDAIMEAERSLPAVKSLVISSLTYKLLLQLHELASTTATNSLYTRCGRLTPVLEYIDAHYNEAITLKQLSSLLGVTPQHLCTLFRKITNTRIFEYINLVRIKKSKEHLLAQPDMAIRDIAHANGFDDVSYFCYIFKRIEKITPGDFRKLYMRS